MNWILALSGNIAGTVLLLGCKIVKSLSVSDTFTISYISFWSFENYTIVSLFSSLSTENVKHKSRIEKKWFPFCSPKLFFQVAQACDAKEGVSLKTERFLSRNWNHIFASAVSDNLRYFRIKHQNTGGEEGRCYFTGCAQKKLFLSAYHCSQCIVACSQCSVDGEVLSLLSDWKHSGEDTISASYLALTRRNEDTVYARASV